MRFFTNRFNPPESELLSVGSEYQPTVLTTNHIVRMAPNQNITATFDSSTFGDVSKSVDQLCNQLSMTNVSVPTFSPDQDVLEFLSSFERSTLKMTDEQRITLLTKSFPRDPFRAWYELELEPLVNKDVTSWSDVKKKVVERFSKHSSQEYHFSRLRELKYDPNAGKSLLLFVENMLYSYKKAHPDDRNPEAVVKCIKAALPSSVKATLLLNPDFRNAKNEQSLREAAMLFDKASSGEQTADSKDRSSAVELAVLFKGMMESIRQENEKSSKAIVAAIASSATSFQRGRSPERRPDTDNRRVSPGYRSNSPGYRSRSPRYDQRRPPSPWRSNTESNQTNKEQERPRDDQIVKTSDKNPFSASSYFEKFGVPPRACSVCNDWHWDRHCIQNLK